MYVTEFCQVKCKQQHLQLFFFLCLFTHSAAQQDALNLLDLLLLSFWSDLPTILRNKAKKKKRKMRRVCDSVTLFSIFIFGVNGWRPWLFWCSRVEAWDVMRADWSRLHPQLKLCSFSYVRVKYFPQNFTRNQQQLSCGFYHGLYSPNKIFLVFSRNPASLHFLFLLVLFLAPPPAAGAPDCLTFSQLLIILQSSLWWKMPLMGFGDEKMING